MKLISGMAGGGVSRVQGCSGGGLLLQQLYLLIIVSVVSLRRKTGGRRVLVLEEQSRLRCQLARTYTPLSDVQRLTPQRDNTLEQRQKKTFLMTLDEAAINFGLRGVIPPKRSYSALKSHELLVDLRGYVIQEI